MSRAKKGIKFSKAHRKNLSAALKGLKRGPYSVAHRKKISASLLGDRHPMFGKVLSKKHKQKISRSLKGKMPKNIVAGWNKGKKASSELREKLSKAHLGKMTGKDHPAWKGGITPLVIQIRRCVRYKKWAKACKIRDNFICQKCGQRGGKLETDHYPKSFADIFKKHKITSLEEAMLCEDFWDMSNGRTLCRKCHTKTDSFGSKKKKTC